MTALPVCVDNEQHSGALGLDVNGTDRVPALFPGFVYTVQTDEAAFVFKDQRRQLE
jgi:hypothetical protein